MPNKPEYLQLNKPAAQGNTLQRHSLMNQSLLTSFFTLLLFAFSSCQNASEQDAVTLTSPEQTHQIDIYLDGEGRPGYRVLHRGNPVIDSSGLGFEFKNQPALLNGMKWVESEIFSEDETWEMPWGEQREVRNHYNGARVVLEEQE